MTNNNYNYGGNYPPISNRAPTAQQGFATSSATVADPYYGAQSSATPTRTYSNNDYQYQQYPQQASTNNGGGVPEQTPNTTSKSNAHNSYDTSGLGNLAYASGLNYNSAAETVQSTTRYSGVGVYEGSARGSVVHQSTPLQLHDRANPDSTSSRASPVTVMQSQRHAPEAAAGTKSGTAYNLPTPSPAYPQSLINSYPQRSTNTTMSSGGTAVTSRAPDTIEVSSRNMQQSQYTPFAPSQPQKPATARAFTQGQNRQTSTPPAAPSARSTTNATSNAYINQPRSQAARGPSSQSGRAIQTSPPPAATLPPAKISTNVIRRTGDRQTPTAQNISNQPSQYQPAPTSQLPQTSNYLPLPTQGATARNQQPSQQQRRPSPDIQTTVGPSHVYNSYHEYQKQIEAGEAEAARLAELKERAAVEEQRRQEALRAQQQRERADMAGAAVQAAITLTHTMSANNAAESESESEESEEDEQGQGSNDAAGDNGDGQQITTVSTSENTFHPVSVAPTNLKGKAPAPSIPAQMAGPQEPANDDTAVTMEEEMRRMVERLRDYQSKDPKLFLQVWSSVRKTSTEQSPQPQAEGSQTQGSPLTQPAKASLQSPTPSITQPAAPHNAAKVATAPVSAPAPPPPSRGRKATQQSPDSSKSPSTQAKPPKTKDAINAKRRAKRPSRSKAALAARAEAERAEAEAAPAAPAATTAIPSTQQHALATPVLATPGKPGAVESQGSGKSTTTTPIIASITQPPQKASPAVANSAAKTTPINNTQQTSAASSQVTGRAQHTSPGANTRPPQQGSTWSTDKRDAIAVTAASVLNEIPENAGKKILARQIRDMLEGNPSYLELCEMIEKLGFRMDRTRFAKTLLAVLPGNTKPKPQTPRATAVTPISGQTASVSSAPQAQASQQKTPQPILPPAAGAAAGQAATRPPMTPGTTQAPVQADLTPGSGAPMNGMERRPVGRPRRDGQPAGSVARTGRGPGRPRNDGQPVSSHARSAAERLENQASPVAITQQVSNATEPATMIAAGTPASATTAAPNATTEPPPPLPATTASPNASGSQPQPHPPPTSATTAPPDTPGQPNTPTASQGPGGSVPLSTEELHHMALLKADVGKPWRASDPASTQEGAAKTYLSPYQNEAAAPPPKGGWKTWRDSTATQTNPYPATTQASPYPATTQAHPYPATMQTYPHPTAPRFGPGPIAHYNPPFSTPTGPPQHGPFQSVAYPYHHHGNQPPLPPNVRIITDQSSVSQPARAPSTPAAPLTKEVQARKRTFAEIIDLTKGESLDKGEEPSEKRQRIDPSAGERINNLSATHGPKAGEAPTRLAPPNPIPFQHHHQQYANTPSHNNARNITVNPQAEVTGNPLLEYDGIVKSIDRSLALRKSRYDPKTIARDILISTGKHPTQRGLNSHLELLKKRFTKVDNTSDLSTFRWDIVDRGGAEVGSANSMPPHAPNKFPVSESSHQKYGPSRPSGLRNETAILIPDDDNDVDEEMDQDAAAAAQLAAPPPPPKRRGRPPRDPHAPKPTPTRVLTRTRRTLNGSVAANDDDEPNELPPPKRRGRPPRNPVKVPERPRSVLGQPRYQAFLCEWLGCKAELQNLETLRRHVYFVHGRITSTSKEFVAKPCLWGKCGRGGKSRDGEGDEMGGTQQGEVYADEEAFREHMEKAHIVPMAWHMGDGPRGSTNDGNESDHSSYLNSPLTGRPVTPSIATQTISTHPPRRRARAPAGGREWSQWEYWCGPKYVLKSAQLGGESAYAAGGWGAGEEEIDGVYGDELRSAARARAGVVVYGREMPGEMRERLGV
ncbi:hypothetical protein ACLOAV_007542 [Pseudogymnoascus australis]